MKLLIWTLLIHFPFVTPFKIIQAKTETTESKEAHDVQANHGEGKVDTKKIYSKDELEKELKRRINRILPKNMAILSEELIQKEKQLNKEIERIKIREEQLAIAEKDFSKKIKLFDQKQEKLIGWLNSNDQKKEDRINRIVNVISGMKPIKAAEILSVQGPDISVKILEKIDPNKASKIFNLMDKEISARIQRQYLDMKK